MIKTEALYASTSKVYVLTRNDDTKLSSGNAHWYN